MKERSVSNLTCLVYKLHLCIARLQIFKIIFELAKSFFSIQTTLSHNQKLFNNSKSNTLTW